MYVQICIFGRYYYLLLLVALGGSQLALQRFGHLGWWWTWESEPDFDSVVDEPLKGSKSTNHDDPGGKTLPDTKHAELLKSGDS